MKFVCVLTTAPNLKSARKLADLALTSKVAACVALMPKVESHYVWKGKRESSKEVQIVFKTTATQFKSLQKVIQKNHPYEVPELIQIPIQRGLPSYLRWIAQAVEG